MRKLQIKNLRIDNDLTQEQISNKLNINRRTYADYENLVNETPLDIFVKIACIYNVSLEYLAGLTNVSSPTFSLSSYSYEKVLSNIIRLREKHSLTLEKLANKIHCSTNTLCQYETGKRKIPLQTLIQLANIYEISLDEICV